MPNEQLEIPFKTYTCTYHRYLVSKEAGDNGPPQTFAPLAKHQWYRWEQLHELVNELEHLDLQVARLMDYKPGLDE